MNMLLNIAEFQPQVSTLGPGLRFALWVQGCPFNCKGCVSPDWIPFRLAQAWLIEDMAKRIVDTPDIRGISLSGGEPMMQAKRLAHLLERVALERPGLDVIVFTGFKRAQLVWEDAQCLLAFTDVLVDGLYVAALNDDKGLRGSSNQQIHFLSDAFEGEEAYFSDKPRDLAFHIKDDGILMAGIPQKDFRW